MSSSIPDREKATAIKAVGTVDDAMIAQIIGTGATVNELAEAQAWVTNDEPLINADKPLPNGRVGELVDILSELEPSEHEEVVPPSAEQKMPRPRFAAPG